MLFKFLFGIAFVLTSNHVFKLVDKLGYLRYYHKHHPGRCRAVPGVLHGSEDFAVTSKGDVFITTGLAWRFNSPGYTAYEKKNKIQGGIFLFRFSKPDQAVTRLSFKPDNSFNTSLFKPHGIDMIEDKVKGEHILFVISHPPAMSDRVEKFRYLPKTNELEHLKTYTDEQFLNLNDLAVVGPDSFYTTNMVVNRVRTLALAEMLAMLKWGSVLYHSDGKVQQMVSGLFQPNGITLSKDRRYMYVSATDTLYLFTRQEDSSLELSQELVLNTQLDNIQQSQDENTLFIGSHPKVHRFVEADEDPENIVAPSQVLSIPLKDGLFQEQEVTELLYDHGKLISGSSVAVVVDGKMLVGTVQDKMALCDLTLVP